MTQEGPNRPEPQLLKLDGTTTAIAVLDLSRRCENPQEVCSKLMLPVAEFLERARQASVPILYTISAAGKGTSLGEVAAPLKQRESDPGGERRLQQSGPHPQSRRQLQHAQFDRHTLLRSRPQCDGRRNDFRHGQ